MKYILKIVIWVLIIVWFIAVMGFVRSEMDEVICSRVDIVLKDSMRNSFVSVQEIRVALEGYEPGIQGYPVRDINTRSIERDLEKDPYIRNTEVYYDVTGRLSIDIYQREPVLRIMPDGGKGFYIDRDGYFLPLASDYTAHIMLASGAVGELPDFTKYPALHAFDEKAKKKYHQLTDLYVFSKYISGHPFWSSQVVQIYVNRKGEYELIPRVGAHQILLGDMEHFALKLKNLEALYEQGLARNGWNNYEKINLKYLNQVICTKR